MYMFRNSWVIIRRQFVHAGLFGIFFMCVSLTLFHLLDCLHKCVNNIPHKTVCTNSLPDDEPMRFETCINLKRVHFLGLRYLIYHNARGKIHKIRRYMQDFFNNKPRACHTRCRQIIQASFHPNIAATDNNR
jgi:hypothetical protein